MEQILTSLQQRIRDNRNADPKLSYVAKLHKRGIKKIAQKIGEEGVELAIACVSEGKKEVIGEAADLVFHLMVALDYHGLHIKNVIEELGKREGTSGIAEKASRVE
jgi:phosphoribosyl-ATP pyrophosphohydrolase